MNKFYDQADLIILAPSQPEFASVCSVPTNGTQYMYILSFPAFESAMTIQGPCQIFLQVPMSPH